MKAFGAISTGFCLAAERKELRDNQNLVATVKSSLRDRPGLAVTFQGLADVRAARAGFCLELDASPVLSVPFLSVRAAISPGSELNRYLFAVRTSAQQRADGNL